MDTLYLAQSAAERAALPLIWWLAPIASIIALGYAYYFYVQVNKESEGTERMIEAIGGAQRVIARRAACHNG